MKILVISSSFTDNLRTTLNVSAHQLIEIEASTITATSDFPEYNLLVLVQTSNLTNAGSERLLRLMLERQQPVIVGNLYTSTSGTGTSAKHGLGILNLASTISETNSRRNSYVSLVHSSMDPLQFIEGTVVPFYNSATYVTTCSGYIGTGYNIHTRLDNASGQGVFVHFPKNVATNNVGATYPFDVYFMGCLSANTAQSLSYVMFTHKLLEELAVNYFIQGSIKDSSGNPVARSVGVYDMTAKSLLSIVKSSSTDGSFSFTFNSTYKNPKVFAIAFPLENSQEIPQFIYDLTPNILQD